MYTISGGRRLYTQENGKHKFIKRDQVFETETINVLIKPMKFSRYDKATYIEKQLTFKQGVGEYKLVNSKPLIESLYIKLLITTGSLLLFGYLLVVIDDKTAIAISNSLIATVGILWLLSSAITIIYFIYFKSNYRNYTKRLLDCELVKVEHKI